VSYVPFLKSRNLNAFWNYNKTLFIRLWTSVLYSGFLYVGISTAIGSMDLLFDLDVPVEIYLDALIIIVGLFNTWFFVSGIPEDLDQLEEVKTYPKGLKVFSQYILLPILIIYLLILYSYTSKIIYTWDWPRGIVSYLIVCVSTLGILTLLLVYPYSIYKENNWINRFSKIYYFLLMPLIVILFIAIGFRIGDYGITINRYLIALLGIWLSLVSIYFSIQKKNIKFIPISLSLILLLASFGPWSMFSIAERSQSKRLISILKKHKVIIDNKVQNEAIWNLENLPKFESDNLKKNQALLNDSLNNEVKSILDYLDNHHGFSSINLIFSQNIDSLIKESLDSNEYLNESQIYMQTLGLDYSYRYYQNNISPSNSPFYRITQSPVDEVSGYDYYYSFFHSNYGNDNKIKKQSIVVNNISFQLEINNKKREIVILQESDTTHFDLSPVIESVLSKYRDDVTDEIPKEEMALYKELNSVDYKVQISSFRLGNDSDSSRLRNLNGYLLFKIKNRADE
jgi:hypothetical protein